MLKAFARRLSFLCLAFAMFIPADNAQACGSDALGTARVLAVDPAIRQVGRKQFAQTLPLGPREVVLTFDDGPLAATTSRVLKALKAECVRATFFLIGRNAAANPTLVRQIAAEGHNVAHHSNTHPIMTRMRHEQALEDIDKGIAADEVALIGRATAKPATPFFRFPGFAHTPELLSEMARRGIIVFGADLWASDWNVMSAEQQLRLITARLDALGGGIVLFHDTRQQTAAMIPAFLRYLKTNGYKVVHIVPAPR